MSLSSLIPDSSRLMPEVLPLANGRPLHLFRNDSLGLLKFDVTFEAGSGYQPKRLCAAMASRMLMEGTRRRTAQEVAQFIDRRGIVADRDLDTYCSTLTFYALDKYAQEAADLLYEVPAEPQFTDADFQMQLQKRSHLLKVNFQKTSYLARIRFYESLYSLQHPMGRYATPDDVDKISADEVRQYQADRYCIDSAQLILAGNCPDTLFDQINTLWGRGDYRPEPMTSFPLQPAAVGEHLRYSMPGAVQSSLRIGRLLPMAGDSKDYTDFLVLNYILGGYFGSRLMSSVREDKGYTYGISSASQLMRDSVVFGILTDVGADVEQPALEAIYAELDRLCQDLVDEEELELVRCSMMGDFLRSIDGLFERSDRYRVMVANGIDDRFRQNQMESIRSVTPQRLRDLAQRLFVPDQLTQVVVGK